LCPKIAGGATGSRKDQRDIRKLGVRSASDAHLQRRRAKGRGTSIRLDLRRSRKLDECGIGRDLRRSRRAVGRVIDYGIGRHRDVMRAYADFLTLWKDADPDPPILRQAKAEYAKLQ